MVIVFILNSKWDSLILEFKHNIYQNQVYLFFFLNSFFFRASQDHSVLFKTFATNSVLQVKAALSEGLGRPKVYE